MCTNFHAFIIYIWTIRLLNIPTNLTRRILGSAYTWISNIFFCTCVCIMSKSIRLNSGNMDPQKTDSGVFIIVSCPKALYHLENDHIFRITVVVADWLGWNPYHRSNLFSVSDWIILKFKLIYRWNFLSALLEWRSSKLIRQYFQRHAICSI